jgi:predicted HNH restriction endonuclease
MEGVCSAHWLEGDDARQLVELEHVVIESRGIAAREEKRVAEAAKRAWFIQKWGRSQRFGMTKYEAYLASEQWAVTRALAIHRANGQCVACSMTDRLEVHHVSYARLGAERADDLRVLCGRCHALVHDKPERSTWRTDWRTSW